MRKPEREIYDLTLDRLGGGLSGADCVFVDDLEPNCETARSLGMTAVLYRDAEQAIAELDDILG
jgi:HAD superfamily hydrolase (TIGR01509 family)